MDGLTTSPLTNKAMLLVLTVLCFKDSEKVNTIGLLTPTSMAPSVGVMDCSCGAVVSPPVPVVM